jgi:hypothetical protein
VKKQHVQGDHDKNINDYSSETIEARRKSDNIFKVIGKTLSIKNSVSSKNILHKEDAVKTYADT